MRLSVIQGDPGYSPEAFLPGVVVTFDGKVCDGRQGPWVLTADEEEGLVLAYKDGGAETEELRGVVVITLPQPTHQ